MANIKELKKQIKSTKSTLKITSAMKLVSASKLAKAQLAITSSRPYSEELQTTIKTISALVKDYSHEYLIENKENKRTLLVVVSANKGLCGGYNSQLAKEVRRFLGQTDLDIKANFIGKKVRDLIRTEVNMGKTYDFDKGDPTFAEVQSIANELGEMFKQGEIGRVLIAYNKFNSAISFTPTIRQVLPMSLDQAEKDELKEKFPFDFKYDPGPSEILDGLIPEAYITATYTCMLDALAAEHGSRMAAMDSATGNCQDAIKNLTIKMNKLRQAAITTELIEVVSGAESLNG